MIFAKRQTARTTVLACSFFRLRIFPMCANLAPLVVDDVVVSSVWKNPYGLGPPVCPTSGRTPTCVATPPTTTPRSPPPSFPPDASPCSPRKNKTRRKGRLLTRVAVRIWGAGGGRCDEGGQDAAKDIYIIIRCGRSRRGRWDELGGRLDQNVFTRCLWNGGLGCWLVHLWLIMHNIDFC